MSKCGRCVWSTWVNMGEEGEFLRACVYILRHGGRRPCPGGEACTVFADRASLPVYGGGKDREFKEVG